MATEPDIQWLRAAVQAAQEEFDLAVVFHEVWKPAAHDSALHERMSYSYAGQAFEVIRLSLRREMLLALMRIWDADHRAVGVLRVCQIASRSEVIDQLARDRAAKFGGADVYREMRRSLGELALEAASLAAKYDKDGSNFELFNKLLRMRHQFLAHRQVKKPAASVFENDDSAIEEFYQNTLRIIHLLMSLVLAVGYEPRDATEVWRFYAERFWAGVYGDKGGHSHAS